jgi:hypothetical protein
LGADGDPDGDGDADGLLGLLAVTGLGADATIGGGDTDGDGEHGSLIDLDTNADSGGEVGDGLVDDVLNGDLIGDGLLSGDLLGGDDGSLLNVDLSEGDTDTDDSLIDIDADGALGEDNALSGIVETVEDVIDENAGEIAGGDLLGGDLLGDDLLGDLDIGDTLAQLGSGDVLDTGLTDDLADVGAITGIVEDVVDTVDSTVDGLLGETDLFNILDTDGLLGDG